MMNRRTFVAGLGTVLATPLGVGAQQAGTVHRIGFLRVGHPPAPWLEAFRQGLRERGYVEGQSFVIDFGLGQNAAELPEIAGQLVARKVGILIASGTPSVVPAKNATKTIPVIFVAAVDPVAAGVTASLARPGANVTGITAMHADLVSKRLGLFKELLPKVTRFALLARAASPATAQYVKQAEQAAQTLGVQLHVLSLRDPSELDSLILSLQRPSALIVADDAVFTAHRRQIAELALKTQVPTAYGFSDMVEAGGLMAYGPHYGDMYRRAAFQVDKLLKGAMAAELPVEQPIKFEFVINLKTAKALGLTIPPSLLLRADQVME